MNNIECKLKIDNFDILKVKPEDFASQLTLKDLPIFKKITIDELVSNEWTNKKSNNLTPNISEFTQCFNVICIWVQNEILSQNKSSKRVDYIEYFIKIIKKLLQLNNIHGAFAITSALLSQSIYRLIKTWNKVGKAEKMLLFEKYSKLFSSENNWENLRKLIDSVNTPCIPHLGLYLTDLMFIDNVIKRTNNEFGDNHQINRDYILSKFCSFQDSVYDNLTINKPLQHYLKSLWFDKKDLKTKEEEMYQKSLLIEPENDESTPKTSYFTSLSSKLRTPDSLTKNFKTRSLTPSLTPKFRKKHKKTYSLDSTTLHGITNIGYIDGNDPINNQDDNGSKDNVFEENNIISNERLNHSYDILYDDHKLKRNSPRSLSLFNTKKFTRNYLNDKDELLIYGNDTESMIESVLYRFVVKSNGKPKFFHYSQRIYGQLVNNLFLQFEKRSLVFHHYNNERNFYRYKPSIILDLKNDWNLTETVDSDSFGLNNGYDHYQFKCSSVSIAQNWIRLIKGIVNNDDL